MTNNIDKLIDEYNKQLAKYNNYDKAITTTNIMNTQPGAPCCDDCGDNKSKCADKSSCSIASTFSYISETSEKNNEFLQLQINAINTKYHDILIKYNNNIQTNKYLIDQLNNLYDMYDKTQSIIFKSAKCDGSTPCNDNNTGKSCCGCCPTMITDITQTVTHIIDHDCKFIYISAVSGSGAGGVGWYKNDGLSIFCGGGGGASACIIRRPFEVCKGCVIQVTLGIGGSLNPYRDPTDTVIKIICGGKTEIITIPHGSNGHPYKPGDECTDGGAGGKMLECCSILNGCDGHNGMISFPSFVCAQAGDGGASVLYHGSKGGTGYWSQGTPGGDLNTFIALDGKWGSGAGGSAPRSIITADMKWSGNGSNGFCLIEC